MKIVLSPLAAKKYKRIGSKEQPKVDRKIDLLSKNPFLGKALQGEYKGEYSLRAWPLRIIYTFDSSQHVIQIIDIDFRGNVYKN